MQKEAVIF